MDGFDDVDVYPCINDVYREGKSLMQQEGKALGNLSPGGSENTRFRSFIGAGATAILVAWHAMAGHDLLPYNLLFVHYLWALMFMCVYLKNKKVCSALDGGPDPKTVRRKTWPFVFFFSVRVELLCGKFYLLIWYSCFSKTGRLATPLTMC